MDESGVGGDATRPRATFGTAAGATDASTVRIAVTTGASRMFTVHLSAGERLDRHRAPGVLALMVTAGAMEIEADGLVRRLAVGGCCVIEAGVEHALLGLSSEPSVAVGFLHGGAGVAAAPNPEVRAPEGELARGDDRPVDLATLVAQATGRGVLWTLPQGVGVNCNLVRLGPGDEIGAHVNDAVDVVIVGLEGSARLEVDGDKRELGRASLALVRRGSRRRLAAAEEAFGYLSIHRERQGLSVRQGER